jgi:hypothetical protein
MTANLQGVQAICAPTDSEAGRRANEGERAGNLYGEKGPAASS